MKVRLENVRIAFCRALFEPEGFKNNPNLKYSSKFVFAPDHPAVAIVTKAAQAAATAEWGEKAPEVWKQIKAQDKLALHDGDTKSQYAGFSGNMFISASNDLRPTVLDRDARTPLTVADGKIYSGCYVNAVVDVWAQNNEYGKRINVKLLGVQFYADGERTSGEIASESDFEAVPDAGGAEAFPDEAVDPFA